MGETRGVMVNEIHQKEKRQIPKVFTHLGYKQCKGKDKVKVKNPTNPSVLTTEL